MKSKDKAMFYSQKHKEVLESLEFNKFENFVDSEKNKQNLKQ